MATLKIKYTPRVRLTSGKQAEPYEAIQPTELRAGSAKGFVCVSGTAAQRHLISLYIVVVNDTHKQANTHHTHTLEQKSKTNVTRFNYKQLYLTVIIA